MSIYIERIRKGGLSTLYPMRILFVTAIILVIDQFTKYLTRTYMDLYESIPVIKNFFHLTYVTNKGMAFGIDFPGGIYFFTIASVIMTMVLIWYIWLERKGDFLLRLSLAMILAGAIGNLIDRLFLGEVTDFMDFMFGSYHWYIFNIADSSVTVGMILFLIHSFFIQPKTAVSSGDS
ncbi:MAG: signal peptidase II [FCB group bacterium]|nr:signal peptidase II [FCB group bacterium]